MLDFPQPPSPKRVMWMRVGSGVVMLVVEGWCWGDGCGWCEGYERAINAFVQGDSAARNVFSTPENALVALIESPRVREVGILSCARNAIRDLLLLA